MKKTLLLMLLALMSAFAAVAQDDATELNCEVEVNSDKITNGSKDVFNELKQAITDYMNTTKWTNAIFGTNEKIYCKLMLTLSSWDNSTGAMEGDLQIQSQRPVYNSSYTTAVINFRDTKVKFLYETGQQLVFSEMEMEDNLTAILNFWAYMIIAMDFDTFELNGGDPYYERAAQIVRLAQSSGESGWKAFEDNNNRPIRSRIWERFMKWLRCRCVWPCSRMPSLTSSSTCTARPTPARRNRSMKCCIRYIPARPPVLRKSRKLPPINSFPECVSTSL